MADGMDRFDGWLRQRLAETVEDAAAAPRRRLVLPGTVERRRGHPRLQGFVAGLVTAALLFAIVWTALNGGLRRAAPANPPSQKAGRVLGTTALPDPAFNVAAGDGAVWVPDARQGALLRIDARSGRVVATIAVASSALPPSTAIETVAVTPGAVWMTWSASDELLRIDPASNTVAEHIPLGVAPTSLAVLGGDVWVSATQANRVLRVAADTGAVRASLALTDPGPIAAGDGGVWVVSEREGVLSRIDPASSTVVTVVTLPPGLDYVVDAVAAGAAGVWFRNLAAQSVERVDPASGLVVQQAGLGGGETGGVAGPVSIASTADAVWVTVTNALLRVDRRTLQVSRLPMILPTGVAVDADGTLWVATLQATVMHVAPGKG